MTRDEIEARERLVRLETRQENLISDLTELKADMRTNFTEIKTLLATKQSVAPAPKPWFSESQRKIITAAIVVILSGAAAFFGADDSDKKPAEKPVAVQEPGK
jgi:hypothetical protein